MKQFDPYLPPSVEQQLLRYTPGEVGIEDVLGNGELEYLKKIPNLEKEFVDHYQGDVLVMKALSLSLPSLRGVVSRLAILDDRSVYEISEAVFNALFCVIRDVMYTGFFYEMANRDVEAFANELNEYIHTMKRMFFDQGQIGLTSNALQTIYLLHQKIQTLKVLQKNNKLQTIGVEIYENLCEVKNMLDAQAQNEKQNGLYTIVMNGYKAPTMILNRIQKSNGKQQLRIKENGKELLSTVRWMSDNNKFMKRFADAFKYCCITRLSQQGVLREDVLASFSGFMAQQEAMGFTPAMALALEQNQDEASLQLHDSVYAFDAAIIKMRVEPGLFEIVGFELHQYKSQVAWLNQHSWADLWKESPEKRKTLCKHMEDILPKLDDVLPLVKACGYQRNVLYVVATPGYQNFTRKRLHKAETQIVELHYRSLMSLCGFKLQEENVLNERTALIPLSWLLNKELNKKSHLVAPEYLFAVPLQSLKCPEQTKPQFEDKKCVVEVRAFSLAELSRVYIESDVCTNWLAETKGVYLVQYLAQALAQNNAAQPGAMIQLIGPADALDFPFHRLLLGIAALYLTEAVQQRLPGVPEDPEAYNAFLKRLFKEATGEEM